MAKYSSKMTQEQRLTAVEHLYVVSPRHRQLLDKMEYCRTYSRISREPKCMLIEGYQGAGKTTLHEYYERLRPRERTEDGMKIPVLAATIAVPATVKSLVTKLLRTLGDPEAERGSIVNQTHRLYYFLKECGVEILVLDEFQHFIDRDSQKILKTISDWLKVLIVETRLPIVLIGMPYSHFVLDARGNEQLKRRFSIREDLTPFTWGETSEAQMEFRTFLKMVDDELPLPGRSHLGGVATAFRFYCATGGVMYSVMELVRTAAAEAIRCGTPTLTPQLLAWAYDMRFARLYPGTPNPFTTAERDLVMVPVEEEIPPFRSLGDFRSEKETAASVLAA